MKLINLIHDEQMVKDYLQFLPSIEKRTVRAFSLAARKKYAKHLTIKMQKDGIIHTRYALDSKSQFNTLISLLPIEGVWKDKNDIDIPPEVFALYCGSNLRSLDKANNKMIQESVARKLSNELVEDTLLLKAPSKYINNAKYRVDYIVIDIDIKSEELLEFYLDLLTYHVKAVIETRGGYHILASIPPSGTDKNMVYTLNFNKHTNNHTNVEIFTDTPSPIPGTIQGGFPVTIKYL